MVKQYDYLIVGAGLYGAAFAYRARQRGKSSPAVRIRAVTFIARRSKVSACTNTVRIFSTLPTARFGILSVR